MQKRIIKTFEEYNLNEAASDIREDIDKNAAGLCIICDNKILLVEDKHDGKFGIPKGGIEEGEDFINAAMRETFEETKINIKREQIDPEPHVVHSYDDSGKIKRQLVYYMVPISSLDEIGLESHEIDNGMLQKEEISWAGFVSPNEAYPKVSRSQLIILDRHLSL